MDYEAKLTAAGVSDIEIEPTVVHERATLESWAQSIAVPLEFKADNALDQFDGAATNAFIRARR